MHNQEFNAPNKANARRRLLTLSLDRRGHGEGGINNSFHTTHPAFGHPLPQRTRVRSGVALFGRAVIAVVAFILTMTSACATGPSGESSDRRSGLYAPSQPIIMRTQTFRNAVILDFYEERSVKVGEPYTCPLTGLTMTPGVVDDGAGVAVADLFRSSMVTRGFSVSSLDETRKIAGELMTGRPGGYTEQMGLAVGRKLEADVVIQGIVVRYAERVGGRFSVDRPASVAFCVAVINVSDGRIIWKARFDKAQKDLLSDVLDARSFFKGGMMWQTAGQLAGIGVEDMLDQAAIHPFVKSGRGE